ncbi:MAG: DMT family transporter [Actinomycetes bacterium]
MNRKSWLPSYIALGIVWGCSFIFIKLGLEFLTPFGVAFVRCALGALSLLLIARIRKISLPKGRAIWLKLWVVSLLLNVIPGVLFAYAEVRVTSVLAGIINATTPLATVIVILIAFREERPKRYQLIGIAFGALGVLTVLGIWKGIGHNSLAGIVALLLAVTCYGISFPFTRKYVTPLGMRSESLAAAQITTGAFTLLPFFLIDGIARDQFRIGPMLAMFALGVLGTGYAYIWNFSIISAAGSSIASTVTYLTPVVAVFVGWIFLGETISWNEPIGGILVILGAAISQGRFARKNG